MYVFINSDVCDTPKMLYLIKKWCSHDIIKYHDISIFMKTVMFYFIVWVAGKFC